jgi:cytochrome P450
MTVAVETPERIPIGELHADPYAVYSHLRSTSGVGHVPELDLYLVARWDDVLALEDPAQFTAAVVDSPLRRTIGPNMLHADGVDHARLREAVAPILRPGPLRSWVENTIPPIAMELLAPVVAKGSADLMTEYAEPLAVRTVAELLGLGHLPLERLREWFVGIGAGAANFDADPRVDSRARAASRDVDAALAPYLDGTEQPQSQSLLHLLLMRETDPLSNSEVLGTVKLMIIGGMQEPRDLIGTALAVLMTDAKLQQRVRADHALIPRLLEECLRWSAPVGTITRRAVTDVSVGGVQIPAGAMVAGVLASANRDGAIFADPEQLNIDRDARVQHMAFALGPHSCIGAGLARLLCRLAIEAVLSVAETLHQVEPIRMAGWEFRGPAALACQLNGDTAQTARP